MKRSGVFWLFKLICQNIGGKAGEVDGRGIELCAFFSVEYGNCAETVPTRNDRDDHLRGHAFFLGGGDGQYVAAFGGVCNVASAFFQDLVHFGGKGFAVEFALSVAVGEQNAVGVADE